VITILFEFMAVEQSLFFNYVGCNVNQKLIYVTNYFDPFWPALVRVILLVTVLDTIKCYLLVTILSAEPHGNNYSERLPFRNLRCCGKGEGRLCMRSSRQS